LSEKEWFSGNYVEELVHPPWWETALLVIGSAIAGAIIAIVLLPEIF